MFYFQYKRFIQGQIDREIELKNTDNPSMLNLTFTALSINYAMSMSPFLAPTRKIQFSLLNSRISHVTSPIIYTIPLHHKIRFDNLLFTNAMTSAASCKELNDLSESNLYSGCVTANDRTYSSQEATYYDMTGANFSINNCLFANCSGTENLFEMTNSLLDLQNSTIQDCTLTFMKMDTAVTTSKVYNATFKGVNGIMNIDSGEMTFISSTFDNCGVVNGVNIFHFDSCSKIIFEKCTFNNTNSDIKVDQTADFRFDNVDYNATKDINLDGKSYAMVLNSCFQKKLPFIGAGAGNIILSGVTSNVEYCPYQKATASLTSERKAYAITTVVVFSIGFAALFITLIILVTCKVREEKVQYGKLHADELPDDNQDPRELSD